MARIAPCVVAAAEYLGKRDAAELGDTKKEAASISTVSSGSQLFPQSGKEVKGSSALAENTSNNVDSLLVCKYGCKVKNRFSFSTFFRL